MKLYKYFIISCFAIIASSNLVFSQNTSDTTKSVTIKVKGINCPMDVTTLSENIGKIQGVNNCSVSKPGATTIFNVVYSPLKVTEKEIHATIESTPGCEDPDEKPYKVKR